MIMKKYLPYAILPCLLALSFSAFADKVTITGEPVIIEKRGEIYYAPETYKPTVDYRYVTVDGKQRVCYLEKQPGLVNLDVLFLNLDIGGQKQGWNCYEANPEFFIIQH